MFKLLLLVIKMYYLFAYDIVKAFIIYVVGGWFIGFISDYNFPNDFGYAILIWSIVRLF